MKYETALGYPVKSFATRQEARNYKRIHNLSYIKDCHNYPTYEVVNVINRWFVFLDQKLLSADSVNGEHVVFFATRREAREYSRSYKYSPPVKDVTKEWITQITNTNNYRWYAVL